MDRRNPQRAANLETGNRRQALPPNGYGNSPRGGFLGGEDAAMLECYHNGLFMLMTVSEAHQKIWDVDFAYVSPMDWHRFAWGGYSGEGEVASITELSGAQFCFRLLAQTGPLTDKDMKRDYRIAGSPKSKPLAARAARFKRQSKPLAARASRFKRLFPDEPKHSDPLFVHCTILDPNGTCVQAYRVTPERTTLLIAGVDVDAGPETPPVNWLAFQAPPDPCGATAITVPDAAK